jgi:hypothetical protein
VKGGIGQQPGELREKPPARRDEDPRHSTNQQKDDCGHELTTLR